MSGQIFKKLCSMNTLVGKRVVSVGQNNGGMDRQTERQTDRQTERQTDGQADTHTFANVPLLKFVVRYKLNMKFLERYIKYPQSHPGKYFFADIQLDSEPKFMNTIAIVHNLGKFLNYF